MLDPSDFIALGLFGVFASAFLAGSIVPMPSEAVVVAVVLAGAPPLQVAVIATCGNVLGAATIYALGRWVGAGGRGRIGAWIARKRTAAGERGGKGEERVRRWGAPVLALSWVPLVGDALVLAAGLARVSVAAFLLWVSVGKALRYALVVFSLQAV